MTHRPDRPSPHDPNESDGRNNDHAEESTGESSSALYAVGALSPDERREIEGRVAAGEIDAALLNADCETVAALCQEIAATMPAPRKALRQQILDAIAGLQKEEDRKKEHAVESVPSEPRSVEPVAAVPPRDEQLLVRADEGVWNEALPGIHMKTLFVDPATGRTTFLARLEPGAAYPDHRHQGVEEVMVLEGDLMLGGAEMLAGDYAVSLPDSYHHRTHSRNGCLCLVTSMMNDDFL